MTATEITVPTFFLVAPPVAFAVWWLTRLVVSRVLRTRVYRRKEKTLARLRKEGFDQ